MSSAFRISFLTSSVVGVASLTFIGFGLYGLVRQRPFIISARWMLGLIVLTILPQIIAAFSMQADAGGHFGGVGGLFSFISLLMMAIVVYLIARQMQGYLVLATTQESFRAALLAALASHNLAVEESMSSIRLPSVPAELHVTVQPWTGTGQLRIRTGGRPGLLPDIARSMSAYFTTEQVKTNMTVLVVYLILGVLLGVMDLALAFGA